MSTYRCKCGAEITWMMTRKGARMPVEDTEVTIIPGMTGITIMASDGHVYRGQQVGEAYEGKSIDGRVVHWGRCPMADQYRGAKG